MSMETNQHNYYNNATHCGKRIRKNGIWQLGFNAVVQNVQGVREFELFVYQGNLLHINNLNQK